MIVIDWKSMSLRWQRVKVKSHGSLSPPRPRSLRHTFRSISVSVSLCIFLFSRRFFSLNNSFCRFSFCLIFLPLFFFSRSDNDTYVRCDRRNFLSVFLSKLVVPRPFCVTVSLASNNLRYFVPVYLLVCAARILWTDSIVLRLFG